MSNKIKNVIFYALLPFHNGEGAAYARIIEYSKILARSNKVNVYLYSLENSNDLSITKLDSELPIYLFGKNSYKGRNYFISKYLGLFRRISEFNKLLRFFQQDLKRTYFISYPFFGTALEEYIILRKLLKKNLKVFSERNELLLGIIKNRNIPGSFWAKITYRLLYPIEYINAVFSDRLVRNYVGNIVISTRFEKWICGKNPNYIRIPILADSRREHNIKFSTKNEFNIGYFGYWSFKKDGIDILLRGFRAFLDQESNVISFLNLYGGGTKTTINQINEITKELELENQVRLYSWVSNVEARKAQANQDVLILPRPSNIQTEFGFSTKLAEYMNSGAITIATKVSDNALYIQDKYNGFLLDKLNPECIANKLNEVFNLSKQEYKTISIRATETANNCFSSEKYAPLLSKFIFSS